MQINHLRRLISERKWFISGRSERNSDSVPVLEGFTDANGCATSSALSGPKPVMTFEQRRAGAAALESALNASPSQVPAANSPGGRMAPRAPLHARADSSCVLVMSVEIGDSDFSPGDAEACGESGTGTLYVDWGDLQSSSYPVSQGEKVQISHEYTTGAGALFSEYLTPSLTRHHHKIIHRVVDEHGDDYYDGTFTCHDL